MTQIIKMLKTVEPDIPVFQTGATRKQFKEKLSLINLGDIIPHVLRDIFRTMLNDATAEITASAIDDRVQHAVETNDPDLVIDLRQ